MSLYYFYRDDFADYPRDTEDSHKVVRMWFDSRVCYADEDMPDERCLRLMAERILARHLLGLGNLETKLLPKVASVSPFGQGTPSLAELMMPGVFVCMAFVPLAPLRSDGHPVLARLYCVAGLHGRHKLQLDGADEDPLGRCSWFLAGVPTDLIASGVQGRSWLLAAHLLTEVAERRDVKSARNLARNYIVTGDVSGGTIRSVEMLRKPELAKQFANFKWIIPKENDMNIPQHKIERPATLDEAYDLIESMQNAVTRAFFQFLKDGNLERAKEMYKNGADVFGKEEKTGLSCLELVAQQIRALYDVQKTRDGNYIEKSDEEIAIDSGEFKRKVLLPRIEIFEKELEWLRLLGVDCATTFYLLAKNGDADGLRRMSNVCPVTARDMNGLTAWDWAFLAEDKDAALLLKGFSGVVSDGPVAGRVRGMLDNIARSEPDRHYSDKSAGYIARALEYGIDPEMDVVVEWYPCDYDDVSEVHECLAIAVLYDAGLLERCIKAGLDMQRRYPVGNEKKLMTLAGFVCTWPDSEFRDEILSVLAKHGGAQELRLDCCCRKSNLMAK